MSRTCIVVSPYFPPSMLAGVHRARHLARHLPAAGWTPVILCVDEACHEERLDPSLAQLVPGSVEVIKVGAVSPRLTRPFGVGEIGLRGFAPLRRALLRLLESRPVEAVLITGSPYYPMLLAAEVKRRFGVPIVLDFQDPWVSAWGARQPRLSKAGSSHLLATALEPRALRAASHVTSVSERQNAELADRYPWLDGTRMTAIPIGVDRDDFASLRHAPETDSPVTLDPTTINVSYAGTVWQAAVPTVRTLMRAISGLRRKDAALYRRLRFHFVGTTGSPNSTNCRVLPLARDAGVADAVCEVPQRLPYLEALSILSRSDAVLMIGSDEPHYTASKIYSCLMSGRPWLSVLHGASSGHRILAAAGGGIALGFETSAELAALEAPIRDGLALIATSPSSLGKADPSVYAPFEARDIAHRFADVLDRLHDERRQARRCA